MKHLRILGLLTVLLIGLSNLPRALHLQSGRPPVVQFFMDRNTQSSVSPLSKRLKNPFQLTDQKKQGSLPRVAPPILESGPNEGDLKDSCVNQMAADFRRHCGNECYGLFLSPESSASRFLHEGWTEAGIPAEAQTTSLGNFYYALLEAGLLSGNKKVPENLEDALDRLNSVHLADPENSAPLLFAALIEKRRGHDDLAETILRRAEKTSTRFDSYIVGFVTELYGSALGEPAHYLEAIGIFSSLSIPEYGELKKNFPHLSERFAWQMMRGGLDRKGSLMAIKWMPIEYSVGRSILDPEKKRTDVPTLREFYDRRFIQNDTWDPLQPFEESGCSAEILRPYLEDLRRGLSI